MVLPRTALLPLVMLSAASVLPRARSHAYLAEPRSRNLYASQEPDTWTEDCPHCMDRNEPGNFCGASQVRKGVEEGGGGCSFRTLLLPKRIEVTMG